MVGMHDATVIEAIDPEFPERAAGLQRLNLRPDVFGSRPGRDLLSERAADREIMPQMGMDGFQRVQQVLSRFPGLRMISGLLCHTCLSCAAARRAATRSRTRGATSSMKVRNACGSGGPTSRKVLNPKSAARCSSTCTQWPTGPTTCCSVSLAGRGAD